MPLIQSSLRRPASIAAVLLFGTSAVSTSAASASAASSGTASSMAAQKNEFMRTMESSARKVRAEKAAAANLRRKIAAAAVPRPAQAQGRKLDDANADDNDANDANEEEDGVWSDFGFDVADYSLKYAGCSAVATWSDDLAEQGGQDTVVSSQKFVVFRLCPTDACSDSRTFGCSASYGEYILDMADYLQFLKEYKAEQLERYCEYCEECVKAEEEWEQQNYNNNQNWYNNQNQNQDGDNNNQNQNQNQNQNGDENNQQQNQDQEQNQNQEQDNQQGQNQEQNQEGQQEGQEGQEGQGEGGRRRRLEDAAADEDNADNAQDYANDGNDYQAYGCSDYNACSSYANVCNDNNNNNGGGNNNNDLTEYFQCQQVGGNGYYLGPHCDSDKTTISIGVYSDEDCSIYVGDEVSFYNVMGYEYDGSDLESYYDSSCTSCRESDKAYQNVDGDEEDGDDINELCENLYQGSGKCNQYLYGAEDGSYQGYNQEANEKEVCGFIKNVVTGQYDENGYIYLETSQYVKDNRENRYAEKGEVTAGQIWAILGLTALCSILTIWACFLHRSLTRNTPWRPKLRDRIKNKLSPRRNRSNTSGIMLGRGGSYQPPDNYA